jgi:spore coat polysaccharide biosynthesis protein SpsF
MATKNKKDKNVVAIVQARMGSTRLPGKVLMKVVGKPMLWHIVNRLRYCKKIDRIVVATTKNKSDDRIEELCFKYKIDIYRGRNKDLIDRFYQASKLFKADVVVRITADCPLVDPKIVDKLISFFLNNKYDYVSNNRPQASYPQGLDVEALSFSLIEKLWYQLKDPFRREWFTTVVFENPQKYRIFCLKNSCNLSHLRLTVDYKEDLELIRFIYQKLYNKNRCFSLSDILRLYSKNKEIFHINQKYKKDQQYIDELKKRRKDVPSIFRSQKNLSKRY